MSKMDRPTLILLVGPPGTGKTTYAHKYIEKHPGTVHLSSDDIRKELYGDETIQNNPGLVFDIMQKRAVDGLNFGYDVIYDSTAMTRKDRAGIIAACSKFTKIECHIIWAPIETCIERDAARKRTVGKDVIDRMLKRFQAPYYDEGIDTIIVNWESVDVCREYGNDLWWRMNIPHDNPHHTLNIQDHCLAARAYAMEHYPKDYILRCAAQYHDIGKPYVKAFIDAKGNSCEHAHYYQHQCVSAWMCYGISHPDPSCTVDVAWLVSTHMDPFFNTKYYQNLPVYLKDKLDKLHKCDLEAH